MMTLRPAAALLVTLALFAPVVHAAPVKPTAAPVAKVRLFSKLSAGSRTGLAKLRSSDIGLKMADKVAGVAGSWKFIGGASASMAAWMAWNSFSGHPFDPAPYIGLNLVLSTVAALQAPFILMSQNRQAQLDRLEFEKDYAINLKAEHKVQELHLKVDHLTGLVERLTLALEAKDQSTRGPGGRHKRKGPARVRGRASSGTA